MEEKIFGDENDLLNDLKQYGVSELNSEKLADVMKLPNLLLNKKVLGNAMILSGRKSAYFSSNACLFCKKSVFSRERFIEEKMIKVDFHKRALENIGCFLMISSSTKGRLRIVSVPIQHEKPSSICY